MPTRPEEFRLAEQRRVVRNVYEAIDEAADPLTSSEIQLITAHSERATLRALGDLRDAGEIERHQHPDDGRVKLYETTRSDTAVAPTAAERAEMTIFARVVLGMLLAVLGTSGVAITLVIL